MSTLKDEIAELKNNQKIMQEQIAQMQQIIDNMKKDLYIEDEGFDFEIVCPYCANEFIIDLNQEEGEIECPECHNKIELDWSGDTEEDYDGCDGSCHGCHGCGNEDDEDDM